MVTLLLYKCNNNCQAIIVYVARVCLTSVKNLKNYIFSSRGYLLNNIAVFLKKGIFQIITNLYYYMSDTPRYGLTIHICQSVFYVSIYMTGNYLLAVKSSSNNNNLKNYSTANY